MSDVVVMAVMEEATYCMKHDVSGKENWNFMELCPGTQHDIDGGKVNRFETCPEIPCPWSQRYVYSQAVVQIQMSEKTDWMCIRMTPAWLVSSFLAMIKSQKLR